MAKVRNRDGIEMIWIQDAAKLLDISPNSLAGCLREARKDPVRIEGHGGKCFFPVAWLEELRPYAEKVRVARLSYKERYKKTYGSPETPAEIDQTKLKAALVKLEEVAAMLYELAKPTL